MKIGIPKELKPGEGRVALIPSACAELINHGHEVFVQTGAGQLSGYDDDDYLKSKVSLLDSAEALYDRAELILKVKEPIATEYNLLKSDHILFSYLHLAANKGLAELLKLKGLQALAFETVAHNGQLPLLAPMSHIAGKVAAQVGAQLLHLSHSGKGILLGGMPGTERGEVVVIGAGNAGFSATSVFAALGANVTVFDKNTDKLATIRALGANVTALYPYQDKLEHAVSKADIVIGAVLIPGAKAPVVVSSEMVKSMSANSVVIDISVDQGGCIETTVPTSYDNPVYQKYGVLHFAVTNMPGAVPRTATQALSAVLLPYVIELASGKLQQSAQLLSGLNVCQGQYMHSALQAALA